MTHRATRPAAALLLGLLAAAAAAPPARDGGRDVPRDEQAPREQGGAYALGEDGLLVEGRLTDRDAPDRLRKQGRCRIYTVRLGAGQAAVAELRSADFDTLLRVEDERGNVVAQHDDLSPADTNSRLVFAAPRAGRYRLVVTSFTAGPAGEYSLQALPLQPEEEVINLEGRLTDRSPAEQGRRFEGHALKARPGLWHVLDLMSKDFDAPRKRPRRQKLLVVARARPDE